MEDGFFKKKAEWLKYKELHLKVLCFSKRIFDEVTRLGFDALYVQYFIKPERQERDFSHLKVYFWQRHRSVTWNTVKKLLGEQPVGKLLFRNIPDPFALLMPVPSRQDREQYHIEVSDAWLEKSEMEKILSDFNIFIAPRKYEGIGMAFLEAMSRGMAVVNGYLYDLKNPKQIDFSDLENISKNALSTASEGYARWQQSKNKIIDFIDKKSETMPLDHEEKMLLAVASVSYLPLLRGKNFIKHIVKKVI
jgi:hypothetical protein